ncbi:MAG: thermonuclease family protein, partial [Rhodobacteraceae bacterium]|nr:thermonuclease family protein [Paracoccaceae bacterium]
SSDYDLEEKAALVAERGIHGFTLESPARYRVNRTPGRTAPDPNCAIKGNISSSGKRIYHVAGQRFYEQTGINTNKGERWFCSADEAVKAGWRKARR